MVGVCVHCALYLSRALSIREEICCSIDSNILIGTTYTYTSSMLISHSNKRCPAHMESNQLRSRSVKKSRRYFPAHIKSLRTCCAPVGTAGILFKHVSVLVHIRFLCMNQEINTCSSGKRRGLLVPVSTRGSPKYFHRLHKTVIFRDVSFNIALPKGN
ncbi:uncharacterized protein C8R40DRAFT_679490 [Lentinula edodes]|uniref:uncharacterized protein n=1 Tax=Lentinula edodes TaxID=5353 RepID=UPI001E8D4E72|nr:uncharacterized protein C8R40DRAFT_679490 [Lentinula edodes]KAH7878820.1 hypothetical protein C8R40DRAFT_679490 [Lentinula edodes]